ncbi:MAG: hypothetical protein ACERLM_11230 [Acidimicrobiales bacterium]
MPSGFQHNWHGVASPQAGCTVDLLKLISRHRQAGADLVYKAYNVDIGGG